jgi:hypothetical protein
MPACQSFPNITLQSRHRRAHAATDNGTLCDMAVTETFEPWEHMGGIGVEHPCTGTVPDRGWKYLWQ